MDQNLGYEKHDDSNKQTENRRNGHSKKTVRSEYGDITLDVPRDRDGEFEPLIVKKHQEECRWHGGADLAVLCQRSQYP